jgi:hypothetical protein
MITKADTPTDYIDTAPEERRDALGKLRLVILSNLPEGFEETMSYGMVGYVVPHSLYPDGYHCSPELPLPFLSFASQKNFISLYHMGMYEHPELLKCFTDEWSRRDLGKLDMGKSCVRFKKPEAIPLDLIGELVANMSPKQWIEIYEFTFK